MRTSSFAIRGGEINESIGASTAATATATAAAAGIPFPVYRLKSERKISIWPRWSVRPTVDSPRSLICSCNLFIRFPRVRAGSRAREAGLYSILPKHPPAEKEQYRSLRGTRSRPERRRFFFASLRSLPCPLPPLGCLFLRSAAFSSLLAQRSILREIISICNLSQYFPVFELAQKY